MIIEEFMGRYKREYDFYKGAANLAAYHLERALREESIRAIVSHRAKSQDRLMQKIRQRCEKREKEGKGEFKETKEIYDDIPDLAGVRIALYFPNDQQRVERIIEQRFQIQGKPKREFPPKPLSVHYMKKFPGYQAIHYRVYLLDEILEESEKHYIDARIEIQVASVLMHAWSEVEHDLIYKPLSGTLSLDEHAILDEINGLVLAGEIALERLQWAMERRASQGRFNNQYELSSYLYEYIQKNILNASLGNVEQLFSFLCEIEFNHSDKIQKYLSNLNVKEEIASQILDKMLTDDNISESKEISLILQKWRVIKQTIKRPENLTEHQIALSNKLRKWRKKRNLSIKEAAEEINVSPMSYLRWEEGRLYPSLGALEKISEAFNVSLDELITEQE